MKIKNYIVILTFLSIISSSTVFAACDRTSKLFFGGAVGTAAGAGIGYAIDRGPGGGAILGGVIGGLLGGAIGNDSCSPRRVQRMAYAEPICYAQPVPVPACSTVVYRDVYYEPNYAYQRRMAIERRERDALERARYRALRAENERLRWERDNAIINDSCCTEYHYATTVCH